MHGAVRPRHTLRQVQNLYTFEGEIVLRHPYAPFSKNARLGFAKRQEIATAPCRARVRTADRSATDNSKAGRRISRTQDVSSFSLEAPSINCFTIRFTQA